MDKKIGRTGEQRPGTRDRKIGNKTRWRKFYKEKERCHIQKDLEINERKEGQVNKEQFQEIVLSGIVVKDESTDRKKEVRAQRDNESANEDDDESTNEDDDEYT